MRPRRATAGRDCRMMSSRRPSGVDHVDVAEAARHAAVAHRVALARLALAVVVGAAEEVALRSADNVHRAPELRRPHLISAVLEHADDLAALDLIEELSAELRVVALLVDRERAVADDAD